MSLPVTLPANTLSIYGHGSINGIVVTSSGYQFGIIDQMYFGAQVSLVGQSVLFKVSDSIGLTYLSSPYFLVPEENIVLTENILS